MSEPDEFEARAAERVATAAAAAGTPVDLDTFAATFALFRVSARVVADLESRVHRPAGLSSAGFRVLFTVWVFESLEPRQIARFSGVSTAAVSGVVSTLERRGLVRKQRRTDDRRRLDVRLTPAGRALVAEVYTNQNEREGVVFADFEPDELAAFTRSLRRLLGTPFDQVSP
ncbi:MAG: MarR family transcriptional regulator [Actinomycetota bacterium]